MIYYVDRLQMKMIVLGVAKVQGELKELSEMPHDSPESGTQKKRFSIALLRLQIWKND